MAESRKWKADIKCKKIGVHNGSLSSALVLAFMLAFTFIASVSENVLI